MFYIFIFWYCLYHLWCIFYQKVFFSTIFILSQLITFQNLCLQLYECLFCEIVTYVWAGIFHFIDVCNSGSTVQNKPKKRENLLKFNMLDFDFLVDHLKYLKNLMVVSFKFGIFKKSYNYSDQIYWWNVSVVTILSSLWKFKANFEVPDFCSVRIKDLACFLRK